MSKAPEYSEIIVESYFPESTSGLHGPVHIRPLPNQHPFSPDMHVRCSKTLSTDYPVGSRFKIRAKLISREGGKLFAHSHYTWPFEVINISSK